MTLLSLEQLEVIVGLLIDLISILLCQGMKRPKERGREGKSWLVKQSEHIQHLLSLEFYNEESICSLHGCVSYFGNSHNISNFFIALLFVRVICGLWCYYCTCLGGHHKLSSL